MQIVNYYYKMIEIGLACHSLRRMVQETQDKLRLGKRLNENMKSRNALYTRDFIEKEIAGR